ncbi:MAG: tetratricopeptide repeat protein [Actinobacteria bacterium]|nr:tetratricopeptide repeat protein [Actinomycetota bacterium]
MSELLQPRSWPVVSGTVPLLADAFSRRPETGHGLWEGLRPGVTVVVGPNGNGSGSWFRSGTGKTQLAAAYARRVWAAAEVDLLVWLDAYSRDRIIAGYAQALVDMRMAAAPGKPEAAAASFLNWLSDTSKRWLVVLDGLADAADIEGLWPAGPNGQALVTTAVEGLSPAPGEPGFAGHNGSPSPRQLSVGLSAFSQREALQYLVDRLNDDPYHSAGALDLADALECLPVGLNLAASYLLNTGQECRHYRLAIEQHRQNWNGFAGDSLAPAWMVALDRAMQSAPADLAWPALTLAAVLGPVPIAGAVLTSTAGCAYVTGRQSVTEDDRSTIGAAFGSLQQVGLVTIDPNDDIRTVSMPAALQASVQHAMGPVAVRQAVQAAADGICESWPEDGARPELEQALRDLATSLRRCDESALWQPDCHPLLVRVGQSLDNAGMPETALMYWRDLARQCSQYYGDRSQLSFDVREWLASAAAAAGHADEAVGLIEDLAADVDDIAGPAHPQAIMSRAGLARILRSAGRLSEAISLGQMVAASAEKAFGPVDAQTRRILAELGSAYSEARLHRDAIETFKRCLVSASQTEGIMHPETVAARAQLAEAYRRAGRSGEAIALYQDALTQVQKASGAALPDVVTAREGLALACYRAGRADDAAAGFERALTEWRRVSGVGPAHTLRARTSLASINCLNGRPKQAIQLFESVAADLTRIRGSAHPETFRARRNAAAAYHHARRLTEAVDLDEALLADCEQALGEGHWETLTVRANLGHAYHATGRLKPASAHFDRALRDCEQALGPDDLLTIAVRDLRQRYLGGRQGTAPIVTPPGEFSRSSRYEPERATTG